MNNFKKYLSIAAVFIGSLSLVNEAQAYTYTIINRTGEPVKIALKAHLTGSFFHGGPENSLPLIGHKFDKKRDGKMITIENPGHLDGSLLLAKGETVELKFNFGTIELGWCIDTGQVIAALESEGFEFKNIQVKRLMTTEEKARFDSLAMLGEKLGDAVPTGQSDPRAAAAAGGAKAAAAVIGQLGEIYKNTECKDMTFTLAKSKDEFGNTTVIAGTKS